MNFTGFVIVRNESLSCEATQQVCLTKVGEGGESSVIEMPPLLLIGPEQNLKGRFANFHQCHLCRALFLAFFSKLPQA